MTNEERNNLIMSKLSIYLNNYSDYITKEMIDNIKKEFGFNDLESFKIILTSLLEITDKELIHEFDKIVFELDKNKYEDNLYYKNISFKNIKSNKWSFRYESYKPYEAFVFNDLRKINDKLYPCIGYFKEEYKYPAVLENNREWMLITPNEIETMEKPINEATGNVLTYGLGLGYYAYMVSMKEDVKTVTIVEKDKEIIELFNKYILPQFRFKDKIRIINMDAFEYFKKNIYYDFVFVDIWHDPSDGIDLYLKFKNLEKKNIKYSYWIEDTIKCYIE
ncbi:MAG: hypothetical protein MR938_07170 [Tenericutes bacterium]|nr:hypothetical protein [Mycoplasmatota bacterium]